MKRSGQVAAWCSFKLYPKGTCKEQRYISNRGMHVTGFMRARKVGVLAVIKMCFLHEGSNK